MTGNLQPYKKYNDSGVPWLGKIPDHWQTLRAKRLFQKMCRPVLESDDVITCFRDGVVTLRKNRRLRGFTESLKEIGYQGIHKGDLVIHAMDAFAGAVGVSDSDGKGTPVYSVCKPLSGVNAYYYAYIIREMARSQWILALSRGIRERSSDFRFEGFASQTVPFPPLDEQIAIVRYLDYVDRRIRRYILSRQKIIKLLNEQKQAIIHQAVTRGLDPNVRLKPSGVEWLGDIPEHWDILRSKYLLREIDLRSISGNETHLSMSQRLGLIPQNQVEEKRLISESYAGGKLCEENDLVLNRLKAHLGVFAVAKQPGVVSPDYTIFRQVQPISMRYYEMILRSPGCRIEFRKRAKGIVQGFWRLYTDDFYEIRLPFPPLAEQMSIVKFIDGKCSTIDELIYSCQQEIKLLQDYQRRLISDVVTGKEDILKIANQLSNEPEVEMIIQELDEVEEEVVEDVVGEETVDED